MQLQYLTNSSGENFYTLPFFIFDTLPTFDEFRDGFNAALTAAGQEEQDEDFMYERWQVFVRMFNANRECQMNSTIPELELDSSVTASNDAWIMHAHRCAQSCWYGDLQIAVSAAAKQAALDALLATEEDDTTDSDATEDDSDV